MVASFSIKSGIKWSVIPVLAYTIGVISSQFVSDRSYDIIYQSSTDKYVSNKIYAAGMESYDLTSDVDRCGGARPETVREINEEISAPLVRMNTSYAYATISNITLSAIRRLSFWEKMDVSIRGRVPQDIDHMVRAHIRALNNMNVDSAISAAICAATQVRRVK